MQVEQFVPRSNYVMVKITFKGKGVIIVKDPSHMEVVSRKVIAIGPQVCEAIIGNGDLSVGDEVVLHEHPLEITKLKFDNTPETDMYVLVKDNDVIGIVKPLPVNTSSLN